MTVDEEQDSGKKAFALSFARVKWRWTIAVLLVLTAGLGALVLWLNFESGSDPLFRGKPESDWIKNLKYSDEEQVKEWRGYGEEGIQVLVRGLEKARRPGERAYRKLNRQLPAPLRRVLPAPKMDATHGTRHCVVSLLASLGDDAMSATPVMVDAVTTDESDYVRQSAITYFTSSADEYALLNRLSAKDKEELLPGLIAAIQDGSNWGLRNNAAIALRYYPEEKEVVAAVLVKALQDPEPHVRLCAAEALNRVAPEVARKSGVTAVLVTIAKDPNDQIAWRAATALGRAGNELELAVPALVECLQSTNTLVACSAVWALEHAPKEFERYGEIIVPALKIAAERNENVAGYAKAALARWKSKSGGEERAK